MCDPITIIGLAASVVQIIDITGRLISKSCEIYQSSDGAFQENAELELIITDLQMTNAKVAKIPLQFGKDDKLDFDDRAIRELCVGCNEVADELLGRLSLLKIGQNDKDSRKLESVKYAWKFVRSKRDLDALAKRVAAYREQLHTRIMVSLTERFDGLQLEQSWRFDSLERTGRDILDSIKQSRNLISADLGTQTDYLTRLAKAHHEEIIEKLSIIAEVRSTSRSPSPNPGFDHTRSREPDEQVGVQRLTIHEIVEKGDYRELQECLRLKPDAIFDVNSSGETPLHIAAHKGDLKTISYLLRKGAKKNADNINDQTPLHLAVKAGNTATVRFLLSKGADPNTEDENGNTPLYYVPQNSELSWILRIGPGLEDKDKKGFTAVREFVRLKDIDTVRSLLDLGANVDARLESTFTTPLLEAAHASDLEMMDLLIARGAKVDTRDYRNSTLLVELAWHGLTEPMRKLLDHGANINAFNNIGFTALHETCSREHLREEAALMLIERGADIERKIDSGYTPLSMASQAGSEIIVRHMLEMGADVNAPGIAGWSALHEACEHGHTEVVKLLLEHGANTDARNHQRYTPLSRAARQGQLECVRVILEMGADVNVPGTIGWSALHEACEHGHSEVVKLLLEHGANTDARNNEGYTPLTRAALQGQIECVRIMLEFGHADMNAAGSDHTPLGVASLYGQYDVVKFLLEKGAKG